jgi:hypothetical protein
MGDGSDLKKLMKNLAGGVNEFDSGKLEALGAVMAVGAVMGAGGGITTAAKGAFGMFAVGLGIGGFFAGLAAADYGVAQMGTGDDLAKLMKNLAGGINAFDSGKLEALGAVMAVGAVMGAGGGITTAAKGALGMTAIGLGIGGFFAGISAGGLAVESLSDGSALKTLMENIAAGLNAFDDKQITMLAVAMTAGAVAGAVGGPVVAGAAALGMTLIGAGIGGFFVGLGGAGKIGELLGIDGGGLKTIMVNTAKGLKEFNTIDGSNFAQLGDGLLKLGPGLAMLLAGEWIGKVGDAIGAAWNWLTGADDKEEGGNSRFTKIVEELKPLEQLKLPAIDGKAFGEILTGIASGLNAISGATMIDRLADAGSAIVSFLFGEKKGNGPIDEMLVLASHEAELTKGASALEKLATALGNIASLKFDGSELNMQDFAEDLTESIPAIEAAIMGGEIKTGMFASNIPYKGLASADINFEQAARNINLLQSALNVHARKATEDAAVNKDASTVSGGNVNIQSDNRNQSSTVMGGGGDSGGNRGVELNQIGAGRVSEVDEIY